MTRILRTYPAATSRPSDGAARLHALASDTLLSLLKDTVDVCSPAAESRDEIFTVKCGTLPCSATARGGVDCRVMTRSAFLSHCALQRFDDRSDDKEDAEAETASGCCTGPSWRRDMSIMAHRGACSCCAVSAAPALHKHTVNSTQ